MGDRQNIRELEKPNMFPKPVCLEGAKKIPIPTPVAAAAAEATSYSVPASPVKINCLCSPTTHAGSFRCRYHRNSKPGLARNSLSVGSKLSELARKPTRGSVMC